MVDCICGDSVCMLCKRKHPRSPHRFNIPMEVGVWAHYWIYHPYSKNAKLFYDFEKKQGNDRIRRYCK